MRFHPFLSPPFSPAAWKHSFCLLLNRLKFPPLQQKSLEFWWEWLTAWLTPGLCSVLSCRAKRLPPWLPCRGEAVADDSKLGDWAIMGEFGVEVSAPVSVRRCSSLCLCCCSIWQTTTCCSWRKSGSKLSVHWTLKKESDLSWSLHG